MTTRLIGKQFKDGGRGPVLFDCWGLAIEAMKDFGYNLPDYAVSAFDCAAVGQIIGEERKAWQQIEKPVPGCVIVMRFGTAKNINHIGVYLGNEKFIHARDKVGVCIEKITSPVFRSIIQGFYLPPEEYKK